MNFAEIVEKMGCKGVRVENPADIRPALDEALSAGVPGPAPSAPFEATFASETNVSSALSDAVADSSEGCSCSDMIKRLGKSWFVKRSITKTARDCCPT